MGTSPKPILRSKIGSGEAERMYTEVDLYAKVRRAVMVESMSERGAARKFGISRKTVSKMVNHAVPGMRTEVAPEKWSS